MNPEYCSTNLPKKLTEYLENGTGIKQYRRRAVLVYGSGQWELVCCTVQGFLPGENIPELSPSHEYYQALLFEDIISSKECFQFAEELQEGKARFGKIDLSSHQNIQWSTEHVSVNNDYMTCAGYAIGVRFSQIVNRWPVNALLAPNDPYYPDIYEAAYAWLPFNVYHRESDGRNGQIFFLLPETRAFIADAAFLENGTLDITVGGTDVEKLSLFIKGAYWQEKAIYHLDAQVNKSKASLVIEADTDRLEYYLIDCKGTVYGFHREDRYSEFKINRSLLRSVTRKLQDQMRKAVNDGEGLHVEFKPFVDPEQKLGSSSEKTKLREIVTTVVAFANTDGGNIYLGIDDDCSISGIDNKLAAWAKDNKTDEAQITRYLGALKSKIKDNVLGDINLQLSQARIDDALVAVIEVLPAVRKPVAINQDQYLYVRTGASNRKMPPTEWANSL